MSRQARPLQWKRWCDDFVKQWQPVANDFADLFDDAPLGDYWVQVPLKATKDGKLSLAGTARGSPGLEQQVLEDYVGRLTAIHIDPFPNGTKWGFRTWTSTMRVVNVKGPKGHQQWGSPLPCPQD